MIVHSSNLLVVKATRNDVSDVIFVKSCIACSEVTISSIPSHLKQLNLYLETAEVMLVLSLFLICAAVNSDEFNLFGLLGCINGWFSF